MISLRETARRHDVSPGGLSKAVHGERPIKRHDLAQHAVIEKGRIEGFSFPADYDFPEGTSSGSDTETTGEGDSERQDDRALRTSKEAQTSSGWGALAALGGALGVKALLDSQK